jgi:hypothetical protein
MEKFIENTDQARKELRSFYKFILHMVDVQTIIADKRKDITNLQEYKQSLDQAKKMAELLIESIDIQEELTN